MAERETLAVLFTEASQGCVARRHGQMGERQSDGRWVQLFSLDTPFEIRALSNYSANFNVKRLRYCSSRPTQMSRAFSLSIVSSSVMLWASALTKKPCTRCLTLATSSSRHSPLHASRSLSARHVGTLTPIVSPFADPELNCSNGHHTFCVLFFLNLLPLRRRLVSNCRGPSARCGRHPAIARTGARLARIPGSGVNAG